MMLDTPSSKSKVVRNRAKLYPVYHSCLAVRRLKKFREDTPNSPEVIEPNKLNFRPNFKFSQKNVGGPPPSSSLR